MLQYFSERPYLYLIFAALVALTIFMFIKAGQASRRHSKETADLMKKLKEENELRNEFGILSATLVTSSEPARLFKGVALCLEKRVADKANMLEEFNKLTQEQKFIYALYYVYTDSAEALSGFFTANGQPLTGVANEAVRKLFGGELSAAFEKEYVAFDPDDETASFITTEIAQTDKEFAEIFNADEFAETAGKFIAENYEKFI